MEKISSFQNTKIKTLLALQEKSRLRKETGLFVVEGRREIEHCVEGGYAIDTIFFCPEIFGEGTLPEAKTIVEVTGEIYDRIAYRGGTEGIIAEVRAKTLSLKNLRVKKNPLVVVLESVEKPGNLGAVLRSADAAGADAVIVCDPKTDLYNPNLIRSSIGGVFTVPCVATTSEEAVDWLKKGGVKILTAQLQDSEWYYDSDMKCGVAIVIGTEDKGLTEIWRKAADAHIRIPMLGRLDSLNASVSAAILLFEAVRQRNS